MRSFVFILSVLFISSLQIHSQEKWTCYTDKDELLIDNQLTLGIFEYVDGGLWFVTNKGINIFKDGEWNTINKKSDLMKNKIGSYMVDSKNRIWVGTGTPDIFYDGVLFAGLYNGGIMIYDGEKWEPLNTVDLDYKTTVITRMHEAANGDVWLGVSNVTPGVERGALFPRGALVRYSDGEWFVYKQKDISVHDGHFVKDFYEDDNGRVFFFADYGIFYFDEGEFVSVRKDNKDFEFPRGNWITARYIDSNNNLWLGAPARIAKYDGKTWRSFNRKNGLPSMENHPYGFLEKPDGKIMMTTVNGLYTYDGEDQWEKDKLKVVFGNTYLDDQNRYWIPTHKGLIIRDGEEETMNKDIPRVTRILEDNDGGVWALARGKGAARYKNGNWEYFNKKNKLPSNNVNLFHVTKDGTVWIGTNKGICSCEYD